MKVNKLIFILTLILLSNSVLAQHETELPREESRPYFKLITFSRGFDKDSLDRLMNYLIEKPSEEWTKSDSINYVFALCGSEDYDYAYIIFERLKLKELPSIEEYHAVQHMLLFKRRYAVRRDWFKYEKEKYPSTSDKVAIRERITDVHQLLHKKEWSLEDSLIFPKLKEDVWSSLPKGSKDYIQYVIPTCAVISDALRDESKYESTHNRALSLAFVEFGDFLQINVSLSDAYIAYSIAKYYDRYNNEIAEKLKQIKNKMKSRNYLLPSIREVFPKQSKGLFNFQKIMEKRKKERDSTNLETTNPLTIEVEEKKESFMRGLWDETIILIGLIIILLSVIIFVRVK